ncbi:MAG: RNA polymerase sigma factor [Deltaproteobacteria bacterium]|nr:RNA polymerase sigma factor [Deltaproteobacteria bacterium]
MNRWTRDTTDGALLAAWRQGDRSAADCLIRRYGPRVYSFFASKVSHGADELCQQTFSECAIAHERIEEDGGRYSFRGFLFTIARRKLLNHYRTSQRRGRRFSPLEVSVADLDCRVSEIVANRQEHRRLQLALRQLPVDAQIAVELHYWEGLTIAEISRVVQAPQGTIKARLVRARQRLKRLLEQDEVLRNRTLDNLLSTSDCR